MPSRASLEADVRRAFLDAVHALRVETNRRLRGALDVYAAAESIPVEDVLLSELEAPLAAILDEAARTVFEPDRGKARAFDWDLVDQLAHEWALTMSGDLITNISRHQREAIREIIAEGIRENWTIPEYQRQIARTVGLTVRDAKFLAKMRRRLKAAGVASSKVEQRIAAQQARLISRRARTIARTETAAAIEQAKLEEWRIQMARGELPRRVYRKWTARDPCPVCRALAAARPVPFGQPFQAVKGMRGPIMRPPAHPNCRCVVVLVFTRGGGKAATLPVLPQAKLRRVESPAGWIGRALGIS